MDFASGSSWTNAARVKRAAELKGSYQKFEKNEGGRLSTSALAAQDRPLLDLPAQFAARHAP